MSKCALQYLIIFKNRRKHVKHHDIKKSNYKLKEKACLKRWVFSRRLNYYRKPRDNESGRKKKQPKCLLYQGINCFVTAFPYSRSYFAFLFHSVSFAFVSEIGYLSLWPYPVNTTNFHGPMVVVLTWFHLIALWLSSSSFRQPLRFEALELPPRDAENSVITPGIFKVSTWPIVSIRKLSWNWKSWSHQTIWFLKVEVKIYVNYTAQNS